MSRDELMDLVQSQITEGGVSTKVTEELYNLWGDTNHEDFQLEQAIHLLTAIDVLWIRIHTMLEFALFSQDES